MRHVLITKQQPRYGATNDREFSFEAPENLTNLDQHHSDGGRRAVVIVGGRLRFAGSHFVHTSLSFRR